MTENVDENVGRVLDALADLGMDTNTHVLFFSDHGDMFGSHGIFEKLAPYEEAIRIPFIIGGAVPYMYGFHAGETDALMTELDVAPTTLGLCGISVPDWMEGYDYSHYRKDKSDHGRAEDEPDRAYIKAIAPSCYLNKAWRGIVTRNGFKYVSFEDAPFCLYDLNDDPYEQINLIYNEAYREKQIEMREKLRQNIASVGDAFELPLPIREIAQKEKKYSPLKVKFSRPDIYQTDCDRIDTLLQVLGVTVTDNMSECDVYLSLDGILHTYGCASFVVQELQEAENAGKKIIAVCMAQTTEISLFYKKRGYTVSLMNESSLSAALFSEEKHIP